MLFSCPEQYRTSSKGKRIALYKLAEFAAVLRGMRNMINMLLANEVNITRDVPMP